VPPFSGGIHRFFSFRLRYYILLPGSFSSLTFKIGAGVFDSARGDPGVGLFLYSLFLRLFLAASGSFCPPC